MLKLNKILFVLILMFCITSLVACDYEYSLYHSAIHNETEVSNIELINYNNPEAKNNPLKVFPFDLEKLEVLEILHSNNIDKFLTDIEKIGGISSKLEHVLKSPTGSGIRITYQDNGFTIITVTNIGDVDAIFTGHYDSDANLEGSFGISWQEMIDEFKELINTYFEIKIN